MNKPCLRTLAGVAALGLVASAFGQPALRSYSNYYFFGDSLTDNGNTFALTGSPPAPYYQGRVSNGITYAEYLAAGVAPAMTVSSNPARLNFAFAGATAMAGSAVPNLTQQVGLYQARGITANANGLYVVLAGANDLLNAIQVPANQNATAMTNTGVGASTAAANAVKSLATLGAKNILVLNLPDISKTARFTTGSGASGAMFMQAGVQAYNNDLRGRIAGLGLGADVNVTVFNLGTFFDSLLANASRFGFTVTNREYLGILQAGGTPGDVNGYIFWDGIHPTTKAHSIIAQALTEVLNPEVVLGTAATQGTSALIAADLSLDTVASRLDQTRATKREGAQGFFGYSYKDGGRDYIGYANDFDYSASVFSAGFDVPVSTNLLAGLALTKESLSSDLGAAAGSHKLEGQAVLAFAQWKSGAFFADAVAGYGSQDVRSISRTTRFGGLATSGKTDGDRLTGAIRVGTEFGHESLRVVPFVGLRYTKAKLGTYTENDVPGLNFVFDEQSAKSVDALVGATADWQILGGNTPLWAGLSAVFQRDVASDTRELTGRLADTVAATGRIAVDDGLDSSVKLGARLGGKLGSTWGWSAGYVAEVRDDGDMANQFSLSIQAGF